MRLDKYITSCRNISRKAVKELIKKGLVTADGKIASDSAARVNEDSDVTINGEKLIYRRFVYIMLNKPAGYITAVSDKEKHVVTELIGEEYAHFDLFPAGRLDIDTEGLLILTNDGDFAHKLTSPKKEIYKTYFAVLDKEAQPEDIECFAEGMQFKDFTAKGAVLEICSDAKEVYIKISEGKFHQVKRMCARIGKNVVYLKRVAIGELKLDSALSPGESRELTQEELQLFL